MRKAQDSSRTRYAIVLPPMAASADLANGAAPRKDYLLLAESLGALIIPAKGPVGRLPGAGLIAFLAQAWQAFRRRGDYDVALTMSEQVGLPLALLFKLARCRKPHVMISHYMTPTRKSIFFRLFRVHSHIAKIICYGSAQASFLTDALGVPADKVEMVYHGADSLFWRPAPSAPERLILSAGNGARDYRTLLEAVDADLGVEVVIAAFSPWVSGGQDYPIEQVPNNVTFARSSPEELRDLYARCLFAVVPLVPVNSQYGTLVTYEAMAMGKAVVTTANGGNVDAVRDGETGWYVRPGDAGALRCVIARLLGDPDEAARMGRRARELVEQGLNLDAYVEKVTEITCQAAAAMANPPAEAAARQKSAKERAERAS